MVSVSKWKKEDCEIEKFTESSVRGLLEMERLTGLGEVWGGIAHELNNPLQIILGKTQILLIKMSEQKGFSKYKEDLITIEKSAKRITELIDCLKDLKEPEEESSTETDIDVSHLLENVTSLIRISLKDKRIELKTNIPQNLPKVRGNPSKLKKLFLFLALNAKLRLEQGERLDISFAKEGEFLKVELSDQGKDYSPVMQKFLENPLGEKITKKSCFGLLNSSHILKKHEGDLIITGKLGKGNSIIVRLPCI